jgi:Carboxypeptidase regulatory-like domain
MRTARPSVRQFLCCVVTSVMFMGWLAPARLSAQVVGATVSGSVVDASGAVALGVDISIKNMATGNTTKAVTNGVGFYIAPNLPAGDYEITVAATGFATQVRRGITLTVGQQLLLNLTLKVGSATESVIVTAEAPTVNLVNSNLGGVTDSKTIGGDSSERPVVDRPGGSGAGRAFRSRPAAHQCSRQGEARSGPAIDRCGWPPPAEQLSSRRRQYQ